MKVIIDASTGTIVDLADCYIVDADLLDDTFSDGEVADIARRAGVRVTDLTAPHEYSVWVSGVEANEYYLTLSKARELADGYIADGYADVSIVRTTKNDED